MSAKGVFVVDEPLACDVCGLEAKRATDVVRFALTRSVPGPNGQHADTRGVGSIFLCAKCWQGTAARRRRRYGPVRVRTANGLRGRPPSYAKLTWEDVAGIRRRLQDPKVNLTALSREYGVSDATIRLIDRGKTWREQVSA